MSSPAFNMKTVEKTVIDGAVQGAVAFGINYGFRELGLTRKKSNMTKGLFFVVSVVLSEFVVDYANSKKWIPNPM